MYRRLNIFNYMKDVDWSNVNCGAGTCREFYRVFDYLSCETVSLLVHF